MGLLPLLHAAIHDISSPFQDLVSLMLAVEPSNRPTAHQILSHPWMTSVTVATTQLAHLKSSVSVKVSHAQAA